MRVYKFGGASVNSAAAVRNMTEIIGRCGERRLIVVVSAMGKTTNALEQLVPGICAETERAQRMQAIRDYHYGIVDDLFEPKHTALVSESIDPAKSLDGCNPPHMEIPLWGGETKKAQDIVIPAKQKLCNRMEELFGLLEETVSQPPTTYNEDYDAVVSFGELISTTIVSHYMSLCGLENQWEDVRTLILTDATHREGRVDWKATKAATSRLLTSESHIVVTQGFIAGGSDHHTTTLGREGSDYSAAILSYCLNAESMTIWKDVPGFLNADPKYFSNTVKIDQIPYNEAIELSYYGASVIHPKTVKPLQNKSIPLYIKSFVTPQSEGSSVGPYDRITPETPLYIVRHDQVLLSITTKDFSFIAENHLQTLFGHFATVGVRINVMQNSALSFSICIDHNEVLLSQLLLLLNDSFHVRCNEGLQLITIRHYTQEVIDRIVDSRPVLLEQRSRTTEQVVVANT
ncbi:MAG: aspartate kinase [Bacteroidales bacterium]|nr:aspartate kinase [Bacteroidales bacterium]